jgi:hypothetical protein
MEVQALAREWDKSFAVEIGYADGDDKRFTKTLMQHCLRISKEEVARIRQGTPVAVSNGLGDNYNRAGAMSWYVDREGIITGLDETALEPDTVDPDRETVYMIPPFVTTLPKVKGYKVPMIPGR